MPTNPALRPFSFGDFELDPSAYELRRGRRRIRLARQPMDLLFLLVERSGQLVTRDEIVQRLWGDGVFVDVEAGVNTAIRRIRRALGDSPERPGLVETVPGKGYRFRAGVISGAPPAVVTLGVVPFDNLSGDPSLEYVADGLTEETIAALGQLGADHLGVIGRTSSMRFKRTRKSLAVVGRELGADYLVEGSIRAEQGWVRVTSRLVRVRDEAQVWSASYDREPVNLLRLQRELCTAIAEEIRFRLSPDRLERLQRRHTASAEAYDLYLRGRQAWNQLTPATTRQAIEYYTRAAKVDPDYALAWSGLADAYAYGPITGDREPHQVWPRAREAAAQAVRAQADLAEAQASLGAVKFWLDWEWPAAETAFRRAISLDPHLPFAYRMLGHVLSQSGQQHAADIALRRARELDPLYAMHHALSAQVAFQGRDFEGAMAHAREALVVDPQFWVAHFQTAQALEQLGRPEEALRALETAVPLSSGNSKAVALKGYLLARMGRVDDARSVLDVLESASRERYLPPYARALVHAGLRDDDEAYAWLDRAHAARDVHLVFLPVDPKWDPLRENKRFQDLLARCGFLAPLGRPAAAGAGTEEPPGGAPSS